MKKSIFSIIFIVGIFFNNICFGYSNEQISFDVPDDYKFSSSISENGDKDYLLVSDTRNNIVIKIGENDTNRTSLKLTENDLNDYINEFEEEAKNTNIDFTIYYKSISTIGIKSYKCFLYEWKRNELDMYQKQYIVFEDNYFYCITLTSYDKNYFTSDEVIKFLNSIEIKDNISANQNKGNNTINIRYDKIIASIVCSSVLIGISYIIGLKQRKGKEEKNQEDINDESEILNKIIEEYQKENKK